MGRALVAVALDLDGTLVDLSGAGSSAMYGVARALVDPGGCVEEVDFAGRTDRAIALELLRRARPGRTVGDQDLAHFFDLYLKRLPGAIARAPYRPTRGARTLLDALKNAPEVLVGVVTGNLARAAALKLGSAGLAVSHDFAAWGDETTDRAELLALAFARAEQRAGGAVRRWVVGDTPRDVKAARAVEARVAAVATGPYGATALAEAGADLVFDSPAEAAASRFWQDRPVRLNGGLDGADTVE